MATTIPQSPHTCPHCHSQRVARSRVRLTDQLVRVARLGQRPYRCTDCWSRFWEAAHKPAPLRRPPARPSLVPEA